MEGEGRLELSAALALGLAVVILFVNWFRGSSPKMLEFSDVVYFAGLAVVVAFASEGTSRNSAMLAVSPPQFLQVNYVITWAWVAAFAIEAASGLYGDAVLQNSNNIWTGWIIQTFPMIVAAQFTLSLIHI